MWTGSHSPVRSRRAGMPDPDGRVESAKLRHKIRQFVIGLELALVHQQRNTGTSERLGSGRDLKHGLRRVGNPSFEIRRSKPLGIDQFSAAHDPDRATGGVEPVPLCEESIDLNGAIRFGTFVGSERP